MGKYIVGADVGGTKIAYGLFDERGKTLECLRVASDSTLEPEPFARLMAEQVSELLSAGGASVGELCGLGVCMPSFIDYENGVVRTSANLPRLRDFAMRDALSGMMGVPVLLENDANAAALAEHRHGAGRGFRNMLYCAVSTGLGLGIIIDGRIFRGDNGWAGESGHMIADPDTGDDFESHVGGAHIVKRVAQRLRQGEASLLTELCGGNPDNLTGHHLRLALERGDRLAGWAVGHMGHYLGVWLYNLYVTFNINRFVLGGGITNLGAPLLEPARDVFRSRGAGETPVSIVPASLGDCAGMTGAAELFNYRDAEPARSTPACIQGILP